MRLRYPRFWLLLAIPFVATGTVVDASPAVQPAARVEPLFRVVGGLGGDESGEHRYVIGIDDRCRPEGQAPVAAYRRTRSGAGDALGSRPSGVVALSGQLVHRTTRGGYVYTSLTVAPERPLLIAVRRGDDGGCKALTYARIGGRPTLLDEVDVGRREDGGGIDYVELRGRRLDDGEHIAERVEP